MKINKLLGLLTLFVLVSCASVRVSSDYDTEKDFNNYKTFAFYKTGIDKVEISDLDKKRILRSIDRVMQEKGFTKSETPDVLVNIFTKTEKQVNVHNNNWGYGWGPWYGGPTNVSTSTNGVLYIDLINAKDKQLIWQGRGEGYLTHNIDKKDERVHEFVSRILSQYPPGSNKK
ncbi:DUF4136 domain-containing protein [Pseudofulvibacter geojedonensis]|uniref:DUF4136 domain-containing protein n=1 Tax=Pseudofulvibacter geojedonensis TaxID=1123758 RepID=A0ABW3I1D5_9FLAO